MSYIGSNFWHSKVAISILLSFSKSTVGYIHKQVLFEPGCWIESLNIAVCFPENKHKWSYKPDSE